MLPKIKSIKPMHNYLLDIVFDDGYEGIYDMKDDMNMLPGYDDLKNIYGLFEQVSIDKSRTCIYWNDYIDLPSDTLYEYSQPKFQAKILNISAN